MVEKQKLAEKADALLNELGAEIEDYFGVLFQSLRREINIGREFAGDRTIKTGRIQRPKVGLDCWQDRLLGRDLSWGRWIPGPGWAAAAVALAANAVFSGLQRFFSRRRDEIGNLRKRRQGNDSKRTRADHLGSLQATRIVRPNVSRGNLDSAYLRS